MRKSWLLRQTSANYSAFKTVIYLVYSLDKTDKRRMVIVIPCKIHVLLVEIYSFDFTPQTLLPYSFSTWKNLPWIGNLIPEPLIIWDKTCFLVNKPVKVSQKVFLQYCKVYTEFCLVFAILATILLWWKTRCGVIRWFFFLIFKNTVKNTLDILLDFFAII